MLANLVIFLTASVAALTLLDFLLSDAQKKAVTDSVTRMWNWLDEAKRVPLLDLVRTQRSQRLLTVIVISAIFTLLLDLYTRYVLNGSEKTNIALETATFISTVLVAVIIAVWI